MKNPAFKRVVLKVSGEALGSKHVILDSHSISAIADEIKDVSKQGVQIAVVVGGGNIFRGREADANGIEEVVGHQMGMLSTVINALALQNVLENKGVDARVLSSVAIEAFCESYRLRRALKHLEKGRVVIFAAGIGNPFFTTDSAAALRAIECRADVLLKATNVDGVYSADPDKDKDATRYHELSIQEALDKDLGVMDKTAFALAQENHMPIIVFSMLEHGNLTKVVNGEAVGTRVGFPDSK